MSTALRYLLDTNILSHLIRNPRGIVAEKIAGYGEESICTSIIVSSELRFGTEKSKSTRLKKQVEVVLSAIAILPMEEPVDMHYAEIRNHLEQHGTPIGPNDLLIAAHARSLDLTVVTANVDEFGRVPGLKVVNWV